MTQITVTQPADVVDTESQRTPEFNSWAKLTANHCKGTNICTSFWISNNVYKCGRLVDCDLSISHLENVLTLRSLKTISKVQFVIEKRDIRNVSVAFIRDLSSNGTFINGELIGRDKTRILAHKDSINLVDNNCKCFVFHYLNVDEHDDIPKCVQIDYHVVNQIGSGRFGCAYYVLNRKSCKPFAMKKRAIQMNIEEADDFVELRIFESVKHSNIISFYGKIMRDFNLFLFLEYMDGGNLDERIRAEGRLSESTAKNIFQQITSAVAYLHEQRIVHRNIEPRCVLLNGDQTAKLTNFRCAKKLKRNVSIVKIFSVSSAYSAPELQKESRNYDHRVDIWSLGILLYECLSGEVPFQGVQNAENHRMSFSPADLWSQISLDARQIIVKLLNVNYMKRPPAKHLLSYPWFKTPTNQSNKRPCADTICPKRLKMANHP